MGNDVSSASARTLIPLDDSVCWQLYNGVNQRSDPVSYFIAKQTFTVECRRSIQFLKTIRHPNILKFFADFKTFADHDSFVGDCVHPLANKLESNDVDLSAKVCLGLYQLSQALEFLHEKASISHNNICLLSIYISLNGVWKLGNFECACRYDNLNKKYLSSLKVIRTEDCIAPEENDQGSVEIDRKDIYAIDVYGFGMLIRNIIPSLSLDDTLKSLLNDLQMSLTEEEPQMRPTWSRLLKTQFFTIDYIKAIEVLDRLPTVSDVDLISVVESLSTYLDNLDAEYFNELLIRRLCLPFMFLCPLTRSKIVPRVIIPKDDCNNSWISIDKYRLHVTPLITDLFSYHVTCIRVLLLEHFNSYWQIMDRTTLVNVILPQLLYGLRDSNNSICMLTLNALASMVPVLGADVVIGGQRKQIFTDKIKKESSDSPKMVEKLSNTDSTSSTSALPIKSRQKSPTTANKTKSVRLKPSPIVKTKSIPKEPTPPLPVSSSHSNGNHATTPAPVEKPQAPISHNGFSDQHVDEEIDNDDGHWSDWEKNPEPMDSSFIENVSPVSLLSPVATQSNSPTSSSKLTNSRRPTWNPDAPLGSEYEIPPVVVLKKKSAPTTAKTTTTTTTTPTAKESSEDIDFFKDMTPKVETVELMQQLETMFNISIDQTDKEIKSNSSLTSFSNKFGVISQDAVDNQESDDGNNNWNE